jgi:uncharacterized membrane protein YgcG
MSALPQIPEGRVRSWMYWVVPVVVLGLVVAWETDWGRQIVRVPSTPAPVEPKALLASALPDYRIDGGLAAHSETVQRTLFNATRRPAPELAADQGPRQIARGAFQLMGTTVTGDRHVAFLKEIGNGKTRVVHQGEEINGMKVALVGPDRVQFRAGDDSEELILKVAPGPKTTLVAAPPAPGAPAGAAAAARPQAARAAEPQQPTAVNPAQVQPQPNQPQNARAARRAARQGAMGQGDSQSGGGGRGGGGGGGGRSR